MKLCKCGCGGEVTKEGNKYIIGHHRRGWGPMKGKHHTEETKRKISQSHVGMQSSEETKEKIRNSLEGRPPWNKGKHLSDEHKQKIGEGNRGKIISEETKQKMSEAKKGRKHPLYGKHLSDEYKKKISDSLKGERHWNWHGGISYKPYCPKFNERFKERVRDFFNRRCYICNKTEKENGQRLSVHHISYNKDTCCDNSKPLFVPLCKTCHSKTRDDREKWENFFVRSLMLSTNGKCY